MRKAIVRGLAIMAPPLLTIVLFVWAGSIIDRYVLTPVEWLASSAIVWANWDVLTDSVVQESILSTNPRLTRQQREAITEWTIRQPDGEDKPYVKVGRSWIPESVYDLVESNPGRDRPDTPQEYYHRYVTLKHLPRYLVIPAFLSVFILLLYALGRLFAAGVGRIIWSNLEGLIHRLPLISKVYSSVKQVTDFAFSQTDITFTRVVAVEYPRRGVWSMGFVTGESFREVRDAANEPVVSVLMPTSPMPATGFTISVPKSQTIDLNITIDQAIQFCVSCGVVSPPYGPRTGARAVLPQGPATPALPDPEKRSPEPPGGQPGGDS